MEMEVEARIFKLQSSRAWAHVGSGVLRSDAQTRSFTLNDAAQRSVLLDHVVSRGEVLEKSVSAGAWVFKVAGGEFVCLQFPVPTDAAVFKTVHTRFAAARAAAPYAAPYVPATSTTVAEPPVRGAQIRRRMTLFGAETNLDGLGDSVAQGRRQSQAQHQSLMSQRGGLGAPRGGLGAAPIGNVLTSMDGESRKGYHPHNPRKVNQDRMVIERHASGAVMLCVFDGHGQFGHDVSSYMKRHFPAAVFSHPSFAAGDINTAMSQALVDTEWKMLSDPTMRERSTLSGTTAVCCVVAGNTLYTANAGDSRVSNNGVGVSIDHKPDGPGEKERIEGRGGRVFAVQYPDGGPSPARVWLGDQDLPGAFLLSRSGRTHAAAYQPRPLLPAHTHAHTHSPVYPPPRAVLYFPRAPASRSRYVAQRRRYGREERRRHLRARMLHYDSRGQRHAGHLERWLD